MGAEVQCAGRSWGGSGASPRTKAVLGDRAEGQVEMGEEDPSNECHDFRREQKAFSQTMRKMSVTSGEQPS